MKIILSGLTVLLLGGCASQPVAVAPETAAAAKPAVAPEPAVASMPAAACVGSTALSAELAAQFEPVTDAALLQSALGEPGKGALCQGAVYQSKAGSDVRIYRSWNSTNPRSQSGNWWAFDKPAGLVSLFRRDYAVCYQWSPLDKLQSCRLKPGTKIVVGNGQSALCSEYLSYPVSATQQVFIANAAEDVLDCSTADGVFSWQ